MTADTQAAQATDITTLPPAERALIVLNSTQTEQDLRAMVEEAQKITAVQDKASRDLAHSVGMKLKKARTTIEKVGKTAREDATAFSKAVIDEEKRLKAITASEEERVLKLRDDFDDAVRREEEAKRQAEERRLAEIREKIEGVRRLPQALMNETAEVIAAERDALAAFTPDADVFAELVDEAKAAIAEALQAMSDLHARAMAQESAAALLAAERERAAAELAAKEAEAQRLQQERDEMAAELAKMRAQLAAAQQPQAAPAAAPVDEELSDDSAGAETETVDLVRDNGTVGFDFGEPEGDFTHVEVIDAEFTEVQHTAPAATPFHIRRAALATAEQFSAMADKVASCGFDDFANQLRAVAYGLHEGDHDAKIAAADHATLILADERLVDATITCVDALREHLQAA